ncbi:MAG: galactose-1-phosphate uridylyltransferase [Deltaproteobacteria bacterium]|nr:MAG: galactose-1-phosphate uridylyltransferase [Deltaproteobacteria bacterium]
MSELRRDPILRRWVIIAPERAADVLPRRGEPPAASGEAAGPCPFCPGSEALNPDEITVVRDGTAWVVRVTPDKKPLLHIEGDLNRRAAGMFDLMNAIGAHELVADVPDHTLAWADFPVPQMVHLLEVYRDRTRDLRRDPRFRFVLVLKNHGAVWSRYGHSHSHVVATPFTPKRLEEEIAGAREYYRMRERCVFCDQITEEVRSGQRVVARNADFVTFAPFASEHPYETWVAPLEHAADFGALSDGALSSLAEQLVGALARLRVALADPPYSVALHAGPLDGGSQAEFHWHWEVVPHLSHELGMEWATGIYSNPVPPEDAAAVCRS